MSPTPPVECLSTGDRRRTRRGRAVARLHHRVGQDGRLVERHAAQDDRHEQRGDLVVGPRSVGDAGDERADRVGAERAAVAFLADEIDRAHARASIVGNRDRTPSASSSSRPCSPASTLGSLRVARDAPRSGATGAADRRAALAQWTALVLAATGAIVDRRSPSPPTPTCWRNVDVTLGVIAIVVAALDAAARAAGSAPDAVARVRRARARRHRAPARLAGADHRAALVHRRLRGVRRLPGRDMLLGPRAVDQWCSASMRWLAAVAAVVWSIGASAQQPAAPAPPRRPGAPRLVVLLVIDQFRADYIEMYGHQWTSGLRRLLRPRRGLSARDVSVRGSVTCAGHATIGTGTLPSAHGMFGNTIYDRRCAAASPARPTRRRRRCRSAARPARSATAGRNVRRADVRRRTAPPGPTAAAHRLGRAEAAIGDRPRRPRRAGHGGRVGGRRRHLGDVGRVHARRRGRTSTSSSARIR